MSTPKSQFTPQYLLRDSRSNTGSSMMFWSATGGYTSNVSLAQRFSKEDAESQYRCRETDHPYLEIEIMLRSYPAIDMQELRDPILYEKDSPCYIVRKNKFDGNNLFFDSLKDNEMLTNNLRQAKLYTAKEQHLLYSQDKEYLLSRDLAWKLARFVCPANSIDPRKLITKGKIKLQPKPRETSGKTKLQCESCGKFVWVWNPYHSPIQCDHCS